MPFVRGEFQAFVKAPGRYPLQVAIESHDRSQRLALADAELLVTAEGPMHANVSDDVAEVGWTGDEGVAACAATRRKFKLPRALCLYRRT